MFGLETFTTCLKQITNIHNQFGKKHSQPVWGIKTLMTWLEYNGNIHNLFREQKHSQPGQIGMEKLALGIEQNGNINNLLQVEWKCSKLGQNEM